MVTIWFEPHATSLDNESKQASGWYDVDLSELGSAQAKELGERCHDRKLDAVFCSDLQRAYKTGVSVVVDDDIPLFIDSRLRECDYGDMTQAPKDKVDAAKAHKISEPFLNGESYMDCVARMHDFLEYLKENFDGKTVLIIGHRATQYGLECVINRHPLEQIVTASWKWQPGWKYILH